MASQVWSGPFSTTHFIGLGSQVLWHLLRMHKALHLILGTLQCKTKQNSLIGTYIKSTLTPPPSIHWAHIIHQAIMLGTPQCTDTTPRHHSAVISQVANLHIIKDILKWPFSTHERDPFGGQMPPSQGSPIRYLSHQKLVWFITV